MARNQFIVATEAAFVNFSLGEGLKLVHNPELLLTNERFYVAQREMLEKNFAFKHPIPYAIIAKKSQHDVKVLAYKRTGGDEEKLIDNVSIGFGGHVDISDISYSADNVPDFKQTMAAAASREVCEELEDHPDNGNVIKNESMGFINDNSNEVGLTHYAAVEMLVVPEHNEYLSKEPQVEIIGWYTPSELLAAHNDGGIEIENWSLAVLNNLAGVGVETMSFSDVIQSGIKSAVNDVLQLGAKLHPVQTEKTITFIIDSVEQFEKAVELFTPLKATSMGIDFLEELVRTKAYGRVPLLHGEVGNCEEVDGKLVLVVQ